MDPYVKAVIFLFLFLFILPSLTALCCIFPFLRHLFFAGMFYFTTNEYSLNIAPIPDWTGTARGYAFTAVSFCAVPLLLSMILSPRFKIKYFPPGSFFYFLYFLAILLSGFNAIHMQQWGFEVCKMCWMYVTFLAAFNYLNNTKNLTFFTYLVCSILIILFLVGVNQKYRIGRFQISSTFPHQNSLSLYLEQYGLLALGILMNEKMNKLLFLLSLFAFAGSVLLIIFTYSRGGLVVYFGGIAIVCALSILLNGFSIRRLTLMFIGLLVMLSVISYALPRIIQRFTKAPESSKNTRIGLAIAAKRMANDYRLGIGANNFSEYSGVKHNYSTTDFFIPVTDRAGIVETIYLLVAAECGWWGLGVLLMWFLYYYFSAGRSMFALRKKPCDGFVIGVFGGLSCNYFHSTLEWSLKQYNNFAGQMILYALVAAIAVHRKNIVAAYKKTKESVKKSKHARSALAPAFSYDFSFGTVSAVPAPELPAGDDVSSAIIPENPAESATPASAPELPPEAATPAPAPELPAEAAIPPAPELPAGGEPSQLPDFPNEFPIAPDQKNFPASLEAPASDKE